MTPELHRAKGERIERSLKKCAPDQFELLIEGAMLAGTHWFNVALHHMGFYPPENDMMHAQYLSGADRLKLSLLEADMLNALDEIESFRPVFVRGDLAGGIEAGRRSLELLSVIRTVALRSMPFRPNDCGSPAVRRGYNSS
jgi:hypothetical protein